MDAVEANSSSQQSNDFSECLNDNSLFDLLLAAEARKPAPTAITRTEAALEDSVVPASEITSFQDLYKDLGFFELPEHKPQEPSSSQNYLTTPRCSPTIF